MTPQCHQRHRSGNELPGRKTRQRTAYATGDRAKDKPGARQHPLD
jgi:hypothetical protein